MMILSLRSQKASPGQSHYIIHVISTPSSHGTPSLYSPVLPLMTPLIPEPIPSWKLMVT